jgi:hypothetical protein
VPRAVALVLALLACAPLQHAPEPVLVVDVVASGSHQSFIQGVVRDPDLGGLRDALVIVQCTRMDRELEVSTDVNGVFSFRVPEGRCTIQVLYARANLNRTFDVGPGERWRMVFTLGQEQQFPPPPT